MSVQIVLPTYLNEELAQIDVVDRFLSRLEASTSRSVVFFDESITGYVYHQGDSPTSFSVFLDVSIYPGDERGEPGYKNGFESVDTNLEYNSSIHNIFNSTLTDKDIVFSGHSESRGTHCKVWKFTLPVFYPRKKFDNPKVKISCYLNEEHPEASNKHGEDHPEVDGMLSAPEILPNFAYATKHNILQELNNNVKVTDQKSTYQKFELNDNVETKNQDSGYGKVIEEDTETPSIPRVAEPVVPIHTHLSCLIFLPITVSLVIKLKSTKPAGRNNILLSTLNIEASEDLQKVCSYDNDVYFDILNLTVGFKSGEIQALNPQSTSQFPVRFKGNDSLNLTYRLINNDFLEKDLRQTDNAIVSASKVVNIHLTLQVLKKIGTDKFEKISNNITTSWNPHLDFSIIAPPINNSLKTTTIGGGGGTSTPQSGMAMGAAGGQMSRTNVRKTALLNVHKQKAASNTDVLLGYSGSTTNGNGNSSSPAINASKLHTSASSVTVNLTNASSALSGLKLTFKGNLSIRLGEVTTWKLQAINSSSSVLNLTILVQPPMPTNQPVNQGTNYSSSNLLESKFNNSNNGILSPKKPIVYGPNLLYSIYNSLNVVSRGAVILNNDIRLGPLETNSVFETEIELIGVTRGVHNLDGIKIFDANTGDGLDFGKLVEVFVV